MKLLKTSILLSLIFFSVCLKPQFKNPEMGEGFWTQVSTLRMEQIIWSNNTLYATRGPWSYTNGGAYRSIDGGVSWDTLFSVPWGSANGVRIFIHPIDKKILYIISGGLYKSTNYGQSWSTILNNTTLVRLGINPKNPLIMYVTKTVPFGSVYKTTNGGTSWFEIRDGLPINVYFAAGPIDVNPEYPDTILLGTNAGLYRSTNGGTNWQITNIEIGIGFVKYHPFLPSVCFMGIANTLKSTDFGETWYTVDSSFIVGNLAFNHVNKKIIYSDDNFKSTDTGESWQLIDTNFAFAFSDITSNSDSTISLFSCNSNGVYNMNDYVTSISADNLILPTSVNLLSNYPNPFNLSTKIRCILGQKCNLTIIIYNSLGQEIKTLVNRSELNPGSYNYFWDGNDNYHSIVSSGIYFSKINIENEQHSEIRTLKLVLLK